MSVILNIKYKDRTHRIKMAIDYKIVIGRSRSCQIIVRDKQLSRKHCSITLINDMIIVEDFGTTNGSYINAKRAVDKNLFYVGDILKISDVEITVPVEYLTEEEVLLYSRVEVDTSITEKKKLDPKFETIDRTVVIDFSEVECNTKSLKLCKTGDQIIDRRKLTRLTELNGKLPKKLYKI